MPCGGFIRTMPCWEELKREGIDIDKVVREIEVLKREGVDIDKIIREIKEVVKERIKD